METTQAQTQPQAETTGISSPPHMKANLLNR